MMNNITITNKSMLSNVEIDKMIMDARKYKQQDEEHKRNVDAKNAFEGYVYKTRNTLLCAARLSQVDVEKVEVHFSLLYGGRI